MDLVGKLLQTCFTTFCALIQRHLRQAYRCSLRAERSCGGWPSTTKDILERRKVAKESEVAKIISHWKIWTAYQILAYMGETAEQIAKGQVTCNSVDFDGAITFALFQDDPKQA